MAMMFIVEGFLEPDTFRDADLIVSSSIGLDTIRRPDVSSGPTGSITRTPELKAAPVPLTSATRVVMVLAATACADKLIIPRATPNVTVNMIFMLALLLSRGCGHDITPLPPRVGSLVPFRTKAVCIIAGAG